MPSPPSPSNPAKLPATSSSTTTSSSAAAVPACMANQNLFPQLPRILFVSVALRILPKPPTVVIPSEARNLLFPHPAQRTQTRCKPSPSPASTSSLPASSPCSQKKASSPSSPPTSASPPKANPSSLSAPTPTTGAT